MSSSAPRAFHADHALLPDGWARDVRFDVDADGAIAAVTCDTPRGDAATLGRYVVPGMPNLHSHAFQRAMAGLAEHGTHRDDSFWTWRETMYRYAGRVDPDALLAIAAQLHAELLEQGYTSICEFHYLHHAPDGTPYGDRAAMSHALVAAARESGIGLTLLPTLYQTGGFDGRALTERQRRFFHATDDFLALLDALDPQRDAQVALGVALHSLRAVPPYAMRAVLDARATGPVHIHIAEQTAEVEDCLAVRGARPVAWLLDHANVDARWCLVHATHLDERETDRLARSGAIAGLCPTTEANLGDGLFPFERYVDAGGAYGVGSDSHISVSPVEDLRWLEYGQRLVTRRRNIAATAREPSTATSLWQAAARGGAQASGRPIGALAAAHRADFVVLDHDAPPLAGRALEHVLDTFVFAGNRPLVRDVYVGGRLVVRDGAHVRREEIATRYRRVVSALG